MAGLYGKLFEDNNIHEAIKTVLSHEGNRTAGPDGITGEDLKDKDGNIKDEKGIKKIVKQYLRRCKKVRSRNVKIPKSNGETRTLTIIDLYARIAQQAVYQVISLLLEPKFSKLSYGFREGQSTKIPISKIVSCFAVSKMVYTVGIDFTRCFDNIPLDKALDNVRELGVHDAKVLSTIKHLMYVSEEYNGIGLSQGTILGPILANCYLHKLDLWAEENLEGNTTNNNIRRDLNRHKDNYAEWLVQRGRKVHGLYARYADDTLIVCQTRSEQLYIYEKLKQFVKRNLEIEINEAKTELEYNRTEFLGYRIIKKEKSGETGKVVNITPADNKDINEQIKKLEFRHPRECLESLKVIIGLLNYYDICNNLNPLLNKITDRLWKHSKRTGSCLTEKWDKEKGQRIFEFKQGNHKYYINVYEMRRNTRTSTMDYSKHSAWLIERENLKFNFLSDYSQLLKWKLWTKQKGKDPITGFNLRVNSCHVHHINGDHEDNRLSNLILISQNTHRLIHGKQDSDNPKILKYRKALKK